MITRTIGAVLRGRTTPAQIMIAVIIGSLLGFGPTVVQGPALVAALVTLLVILPANIGLTGITYGATVILALLGAPVCFWVGRVLLDGPTQGLFRAAINAPVLALFGLEYYTATGGLLIGLVFGVVAGWLLVRGLRKVREKLATVEEGSDAYRKASGSLPIKLASFVFLGSSGATANWRDLATVRRGKPVRIAGVALVALLGVGAVAAHSALTGPLLTRGLKRSLEFVNGATVDVGSAKLDLTEGRLEVTGLALADPNNLDRNTFAAGQLLADVSGADLLRKRLRLEHVVVNDAHHGGARETPGARIGRLPEPPDAGEILKNEKTLEDYLKQAQLWRDRLTQIRRWLDGLAGDDSARGKKEEEEKGETMRERLEREVNDQGWRRVTAGHLIEGAPTFAVSLLEAKGVTTDALPNETLDVRAENLSTQPSLMPGAPRLAVRSSSGNIDVDVGLGGLSSQEAGNQISVFVRNVPVDSIAGQLEVGGKPPIQGGTLDFDLQGLWSSGRVGWVELPLNVTLRNTTLSLGGNSAKVSTFKLPLGIRGPIDDPRITIDDDNLMEALENAGAEALKQRVQQEQQELMDKATDKIEEEAKDAIGGLFDKLGGGKSSDSGKKKKKP